MTDKELLARYRAVRLPDVSDALDCLGCADRYIMSPGMRPMWTGIAFAGFAHTLKLLPSSRVVPAMPYEEYKRKLGEMTDDEFLGQIRGLVENPQDVFDTVLQMC